MTQSSTPEQMLAADVTPADPTELSNIEYLRRAAAAMSPPNTLDWTPNTLDWTRTAVPSWEPVETTISAPPIPEPPKEDLRTMAELTTKGFKDIDNALLKDIRYLMQLATQTTTDINLWQPVQLLKDIPRGDKRAINRVFFARSEGKQQAIEGLGEEQFARMQRLMFDAAERIKAQQIRDLRSNLQQNERNITTRMSQVHAEIQYLRSKFDQIATLEGTTPTIQTDEIKKVAANPFFKFQKFAFNTAYIETRNEVVMTYINRSQGVEHQVNFGKLLFKLEFTGMNLTAHQLSNNLVINGGYPHPFISHYGEICFGTAADTVWRRFAKGEFGFVFEVLASLLTTYDPGASPYISLSDFVTADKRGDSRITPKAQCEYCMGTHLLADCPIFCIEHQMAKADCPCGEEEEEEAEETRDCEDVGHDDCNDSDCGCGCH